MTFVLVLIVLSSDAQGGDSYHAPIEIGNDSEFNATNGVVSGNGTANNPFVIEGWLIDASEGLPLKIADTTKHYLVTNITIYQSTGTFYGYTIFIDRAPNGRFDGIDVEYTPRIEFRWSDHLSISNITTDEGCVIRLGRCRESNLVDVGLEGSSEIILSQSYESRLDRCHAEEIKITDSEYTVLNNCSGGGDEYGLYITESRNCTIINCTFTNSEKADLYLEKGGHRMTGCVLGPRGLDITLEGRYAIDQSNTVAGKPLLFYQNQTGVTVDTEFGQVIFVNCTDCAVVNATSAETFAPIFFSDGTNITYSNLSLSGYDSCIKGWYSKTVNVMNLSVSSSFPYYFRGLEFVAVNDITITDSTFGPGRIFSINLVGYSRDEQRDNITMSNVTIQDVAFGVFIEGEWNIKLVIEGCTFANVSTAVNPQYYGNLIVTNCSFTNCSEGIRPSPYPLYHRSGPSLISGNQFIDCETGMEFTDPKYHIIENNRFARTREPLRVSSAMDCIIRNFTVDGAYYGVLVHGWNSTVENLIVSNCTYGIWVSQSGMIVKNVVVQNCTDSGIFISGSRSSGEVLITNAVVSNCTVGIKAWREMYNYHVTKTIIQGCDVGIVLYRTVNGKISLCNIKESVSWGLETTERSNNLNIYHNNFIENNYNETSGTYNGPQAKDSWGLYMFSGSEGNYWSDFLIRYPNAKASTINPRAWDTWYRLEGSGIDPWPLIDPIDFIPPVARAGDDMVVAHGSTVKFDGTASTDDFDITGYEWKISGPGGPFTGNASTYDHTFDRLGNFIVTLTVWDTGDNSNSDTLVVTVVDMTPPIADAGDDVSVGMDESFELDGRGSRDNIGIANFTWTVDPEGLNYIFYGDQVNLSLDTSGDYKIVLNVSDAAGYWAIDELSVHVLDTQPPDADGGSDITVSSGELAFLNATRSYDNVGVTNWVWTFTYEGEEITLDGETSSFTFILPGEYHVTLTITDLAGNHATDVIIVHVMDTTAPLANAGFDFEVEQGTSLTITGAGSSDNIEIVEYRWTLRYDGQVHEFDRMEFTYTFEWAGFYLLELRIYDEAGNTDNDTAMITVLDITSPTIVANVMLLVDQGEEAVFDAMGSYDNDGILDHNWIIMDHDGMVTLVGARVRHTFAEAGSYHVTLVVTDLSCNEASKEFNMTVRDIEDPVAEAGNDRIILVGSTVTMDGSRSTDNVGIMSYVWTFTYGGATEDLTGSMPSFIFDKAGEVEIELEVEDAVGNKATDTVLITVKPERVIWSIGPIEDDDGKPVEGMKVTVHFGGTEYEAETDENGMAHPEVKWVDIRSPANVTVSKSGWETLSFDIDLDEDGNPTGEFPAMVRKEKDDSSSAGAVAAIIVLSVALLVARRRRRT